MGKLTNNHKAFTIVELLISTTVFSVMILGASMMIIQITRMYYKGIIMSNTQTTARDLMNSIARTIQYEGETVSSPVSVNFPDNGKYKLCVGRSRYTYQLNKQQGVGINHAVWKDNKSCADPVVPDLNSLSLTADTNNHDILSKNMRILQLDVKKVGVTPNIVPGLYSVEVMVAYGDDDLIENLPTTPSYTIDPANPPACKGNFAGGQWCAIASYKTMVFQRLNH